MTMTTSGTSPTVTIDFWYEFASTYSYLSVMRAPALAAAAGVTLHHKPFLLGPIFAAQGWNDSPFKLFPVKGRYMWRDMERLCEELELPLKKPSTFPRNGLLAARVAVALGDQGPFTQAVYHANFGEDRATETPEVIAEILSDLGHDAPAVLAAASAPENKDRLRAQTEQAIEAGVFGAPTFIVRGDVFWGHDRLPQALCAARG